MLHLLFILARVSSRYSTAYHSTPHWRTTVTAWTILTYSHVQVSDSLSLKCIIESWNVKDVHYYLLSAKMANIFDWCMRACGRTDRSVSSLLKKILGVCTVVRLEVLFAYFGFTIDSLVHIYIYISIVAGDWNRQEEQKANTSTRIKIPPRRENEFKSRFFLSLFDDMLARVATSTCFVVCLANEIPIRCERNKNVGLNLRCERNKNVCLNFSKKMSHLRLLQTRAFSS